MLNALARLVCLLNSTILPPGMEAGEPGADPVHRRAGDLITEVCFNPPGTDASDAGVEYVEVYKNRSGNIGGYQLRDHAGIPLFTFPELYVPAGSRLVVFFRPGSAAPAGATASNRRGLFIFSSDSLPIDGDYLSNTAGGIQLLDNRAARNVVDRIAWIATDAAVDPAVLQQLHSMAGGPPGVLELTSRTGRYAGYDGTIGRSADPLADYTGTAADFDIHGGAGAPGPTPGLENSADAVGGATILEDAQNTLQSYILQYLPGPAGIPLSITGATTRIESSIPGLRTSRWTASMHFDCVDATLGHTTLSGIFIISLTRNPSGDWIKTVDGRLDSGAGFSIGFSQTETTGGAGTAVQSTSSHATLRVDANTSLARMDITETSTRRRVGERRWQMDTVRECYDSMGRPALRSDGTLFITETPDGRLRAEGSATRDGSIRDMHSDTGDVRIRASRNFEQIIFSAADTARSDDLRSTLQITRFHYYRNGRLEASLAPGAAGSALAARSHAPSTGEPGTLAGAFFLNIYIPLDRGGALSGTLDWTRFAPFQNKIRHGAVFTFASLDGKPSDITNRIDAGDGPRPVPLQHTGFAALRAPRVEYESILGALPLAIAPVQGAVDPSMASVLGLAMAGLLDRMTTPVITISERDPWDAVIPAGK